MPTHYVEDYEQVMRQAKDVTVHADAPTDEPEVSVKVIDAPPARKARSASTKPQTK